MLNTEHFILLAGRPEKRDEEIRQQARRAGDPKVEINLPKLQEDQHDRGHRSVEVVKSAYGWTVRCASGLNNFQLVVGSRCAALAWNLWGRCRLGHQLGHRKTRRTGSAFVRKAHAEDVVTIEVEMQAFGGGRIRTVVIPIAEGMGQTTDSPFWRDLTTDQKLDHMFYYGQNDFQPVANHCSVSVGAVIRLEGKRYRVEAVGFTAIPEAGAGVKLRLRADGATSAG
jgi:hypothetical protein